MGVCSPCGLDGAERFFAQQRALVEQAVAPTLARAVAAQRKAQAVIGLGAGALAGVGGLAGRELGRLETAKADDLKEAEIAQVRAQLAAVERLQNQLASRLLELDNSRGSTIYLERQRMIREAMQKTG